MSVFMSESTGMELTDVPGWKCRQNLKNNANEQLLETVFQSLNLTEREYDILRNISSDFRLPFGVPDYDNNNNNSNNNNNDNNNSNDGNNNNNINNPAFCYCEGFREFSLFYKHLHGYLGLAVCIFGVISNLLNIIVLSRREMAILPINRILRWLAFTDILLMVEYIPFIFFYNLRLYPNLVHSYNGALFMFLHLNFTQVLHTISIFMTLALAFWRYTVIRYPQRNATVANRRKCNRCFVLAYALPVLFCLPSYFIFDIKRYNIVEDGQLVSIYMVHLSRYAEQNDELYFIVYLWVYAVIIKLVPCVILTLITCWLIKTLRSASERRNVLIGNSGRPYSPTTTTIATDTAVNGGNNCEETLLVVQHNGGSGHISSTISKAVGSTYTVATATSVNLRQHRIDRTTRILIAVLVLFIITELPQGILGLLSGIYGKKFFTTCYILLGDLMDLLALFNGAVNFILYCWMSKQFRKTFGQLFKPTLLLSNLIPPTQEIEMVTTNV